MPKKTREADFGVIFRHWLRKNPFGVTAHFELKQTESESIPFDCLKQHQIDYLQAMHWSEKGVLMRNMTESGAPDYTYAYRDPVFIVIKYPKEFFLIPLSSFLEMKEATMRKSLIREHARAIAHTSVQL